MRKRDIDSYLLVIVFLFSFSNLSAEYQYRPYTSLQYAYDLEVPSELRELFELSAQKYEYYIFSNPDSALIIVSDLIKANFPENFIPLFQYWKAKTFSAKSQYDLAFYMVDSLLKTNIENHILRADILLLYARLNKFKNDYIKVLPIFIEIEKVYISENDYLGLAVTYINIAEFNRALLKHRDGIYYLDLAAKLIEQHNLPIMVRAYKLNRQSAIYNEIFELDSAELFTRELISIAEESGNNYLMASGYNELGLINEKKGQPETAIQNYKMAISIWKQTGHARYWTNSITHLGSIYITLGEQDSCINLIQNSISLVEENKWYSILYSHYELLSHAYLTQGNAQNSVQFSEKANIALRKDFENLISKELAVQQAEFETERQKKQVIQLEGEAARKSIQRNIALVAAFIILLLLVILTRLTYVVRGRNLKINNINVQLKEAVMFKDAMIKDLHHRVKNNLTFLIGLIHLQESQSISSDVKLELAEVKTRLEVMAKIHSNLLDTDNEKIEIQKMITIIKEQIMQIVGDKHEIQLNLCSNPLSIKSDRAVSLGVIVNELIINSIKHAFKGNKKGAVNVSVQSIENKVFMSFSDDGEMNDKGIDFEKPSSVGLKLIRLLTKQLRGSILYDRKDNIIKLSFNL